MLALLTTDLYDLWGVQGGLVDVHVFDLAIFGGEVDTGIVVNVEILLVVTLFALEGLVYDLVRVVSSEELDELLS